MVLGGDGHAGHGMSFQAGHVDHVIGLGDNRGEIEREVAFSEGQRVGLVLYGLLAAIGAGGVDEVDAREFFGAAVENGGRHVADGVVEGDVGRRCAHLLDQLAEQGVRQLRRDVGSVGAVAVIVDLVQVQLDDDLLAFFVANGALAAAAVEVGADPVPGGLVGGGVADRADAAGDHGGDGFGVGIGVVPQIGR